MKTEVLTTDAIEQQLLAGETAIARIRTAQMTLLGELDRRQAHTADGCRTMAEWVTARLDVAPETAKMLMTTARRLESLPTVRNAATDGSVSFDRCAAIARITNPSDDRDAVDGLAVFDIAGIRRLASRRHRLTRDQEREAFDRRHVVAQPNLDESSWKVHARLPGIAGKTLVDALDQKADELPNGGSDSRSTRRADALWQISLDALQGSDGASVETASPLLTVFMDANDAAPTNGEAGAWIQAGPRVGLDTLDAILCDGVIEVTARTPDGIPLNMGRRTRAIPPRLRRLALARDDGCTIAGCTSRYRLQVHHITSWSQGGPTDAANLATVCRYHHHIAIHGRGFTIDPDSPTHRRRLLHPTRAPPEEP
ncbi:MAG: DUF222 domain-containing protein [Actinomycetota bacterium]